MHPQVPTVQVSDVPDPIPDDVAVLDVREQEEWDYGHIEGAVHLPVLQLVPRLDEVPFGQRLLVVCKIGGRSMQAVDYLVRKGYDAVNLDGGMVEWVAAGRPMVSETGRPAQLV